MTDWCEDCAGNSAGSRCPPGGGLLLDTELEEAVWCAGDAVGHSGGSGAADEDEPAMVRCFASGVLILSLNSCRLQFVSSQGGELF